ncbi:MAG TPA: antibiotic biosynthesis monooxygenase [Dehalococcoidia bacterium]|nr:antibiotic biosynthesis monooxygenase [Dehalococcoidia bacterium]
MILEVAILDVKPDLVGDFENAFREASQYIAATPGYVSHELQRCLEDANRYILLVQWQTLEAHTQGFRGSPGYQEWRRLLHHFYDPFPTVQHYESVFRQEAPTS